MIRQTVVVSDCNNSEPVSQYVIEFGAETVRAIAEAITRVLLAPYDISVDEPQRECNYVSVDKPLSLVIDDLEKGAVASAIIRGRDERIRYALITRPRFNKSKLSKWMGTIEVTFEDWSFAWESLLEQNDLLFVCVGEEEGVELSDEQLGPDAFPWTQWPLLIGAIRSRADRQWVTRTRASVNIGKETDA